LDDSNIHASPELTAAVRNYGAGTAQPPHAHEAAGVSLILAGSLEEEVGRTVHRAGAGAMVGKPAGTEHADRFGRRGAVMLSLSGPVLDGTVDAWQWAAPAAAWPLGLAALRSARERNSLACEEKLLALLAVLPNSAALACKRAATDEALAVLDHALAHRHAVPSVSELARQAQVHPVSLTRAFRRRHGVSISRYVRRRRVAEASEWLAATELSVGAVAAELQFFDQSHLCRAFAAETGMSPSRYRSLLR
jgi:AraC family transcriptional regulator